PARRLLARGLLAGRRSPAHQARALSALPRPPGARPHPRADRRPAQLHRHPPRRRRRRGLAPGAGPRADDPADGDPALEPGRRGGESVSREIVEAVKVLEQEKGIDSDTLMSALEDALLSAYKKTPGAAKYARVDLDRDTADFRVFEL